MTIGDALRYPDLDVAARRRLLARRLPGDRRGDDRRARLPPRRRRRRQRRSCTTAIGCEPRSPRRLVGAVFSTSSSSRSADGPGLVVLAGAFPDTVDRRSGERCVRARSSPTSTRPGSPPATTTPSRVPTTGSGTRSRSSPCATPTRSSSTTATRSSSSCRRRGSARTSRSRRRSTSSTRAAPPRFRTATITSGSSPIEVAEQFPAHAHRLSAVLTLQGAVAHTDMPVESGPTMYLPHSQKYELGYLAWRRPDFAEYFAEHHVQLPLAKGDAAFFNPALSHAAGHNRSSDIKRMANLLQVSSAFGRPMESVDREAMSNALFPALSRRARTGTPEDAAAQRDRGLGRGLPVPDQPRPRSTDRRTGARDPGRARVAGRDRALGSGATPHRAARLRRTPPHRRVLRPPGSAMVGDTN